MYPAGGVHQKVHPSIGFYASIEGNSVYLFFMKVFRYILAAVLFAAAFPLYAQWSCGVDAAAGIGYLGQRMEDLDQPLHRYSGQGALRLGYRSPRFT